MFLCRYMEERKCVFPFLVSIYFMFDHGMTICVA
uniref:Uncharacterized protein n=1 Tax=Rhizophora mucronata TaxID=61149 RepID=A0A2P2PM54_RHIMU